MYFLKVNKIVKILVSLLPTVSAVILDRISKKYDVCSYPNMLTGDKVREEQVYLHRKVSVYCCADWFNMEENMDFNVTWGYTSAHSNCIDSTSFSTDANKFSQRITTLSVSSLDEGTYICNIIFADGTHKTSAVSLKVYQPFMTVMAEPLEQSEELDEIIRKYDSCWLADVLTVDSVREQQMQVDLPGSIYCCADWFYDFGKMRVDFNISWRFDGIRSNDMETTSFSLENSTFNQRITTLSVNHTDEGTYVCNVTFVDGTYNTSRITLTTYRTSLFTDKPNLQKTPLFINASIGDSKQLNCSFFVGNSSESRMTWQKVKDWRIYSIDNMDGVIVKENTSDCCPLLNGTLQLSNISKEHFGTYTCFVEAENQTASQNITVLSQAPLMSTTLASGTSEHVDKKFETCLFPNKLTGDEEREEQMQIHRPFSIYCCADWFIAPTITRFDFNVSWDFSGGNTTGIESTTFLTDDTTFNQRITTLSINEGDEGTYFCNVTFVDGLHSTSRVALKIYRSSNFRGEPHLHEVSSFIYASIGDSKQLKCSYFIGDYSNLSIIWRKVEGGQIFNVEDMEGVIVKKNTYDSDHILRGALQLPNIAKYHFGTYTCSVETMDHNTTAQNIMVLNQATPDAIRMQEITQNLTIAVSMSLLVIFFLVIIYFIRNRLLLKIRMLKSHIETDLPRNEFDLFIVHGPTSLKWVNEYLLQKLERKFHLKCFLPERDILAGEEQLEAMCKAMEESDRVLIVVTRCLKSSRWCTYITLQAIHRTLSSRMKTFAVMLTDLSSLSDQEKDETIFKIISHLRNVQCPPSHNIEGICEETERTLLNDSNKSSDIYTKPGSRQKTAPKSYQQLINLRGALGLLSRRRETLFWEKILLFLPAESLHKIEQTHKCEEQLHSC